MRNKIILIVAAVSIVLTCALAFWTRQYRSNPKLAIVKVQVGGKALATSFQPEVQRLEVGKEDENATVTARVTGAQAIWAYRSYGGKSELLGFMPYDPSLASEEFRFKLQGVGYYRVVAVGPGQFTIPTDDLDTSALAARAAGVQLELLSFAVTTNESP